MNTLKVVPGFLCFCVMINACNDVGKDNVAEKKFTAIDIPKIEKVIGMKGVTKEGEYKVTVAQNDLHVVVDGFKIIPFMGLGSWAAFTSVPDGAMVMGDIILTETDLKPVQAEVIRQGLTISAIHNHFLRIQCSFNALARPVVEPRPSKCRNTLCGDSISIWL